MLVGNAWLSAFFSFDVKVLVVGIGIVPAFALLGAFRSRIDTAQVLAVPSLDIWPLSLLYVSIASAGFITSLTVSFMLSGAVNSQPQFSAEHYLLFLAFLATAIPFYHGALTYLQRTADSGKRTMVDFLALLTEAFIILVLSASSADPSLFVTWLFVLFTFDIGWLLFALSDHRKDPPPAVWLWLNISMSLFLIVGLLLGIVSGALAFLLMLALVSVGRSVVDYAVAWPVYFPLRNKSSTSVLPS
jgi:hypothetical protein